MDNLMTVVFEAHNPEANHHRRYQLTLGRDLLDDWTVTVSHGRVGQAGQERQFASPNAETIKGIVHDRLRRRLSAPRRIGCAYRLTTLDTAQEFDCFAWLPQELLAAFAQNELTYPIAGRTGSGRATALFALTSS